MKKFLKVITLLLVFAMLLGAFAACAKKDGEEAASDTVSTNDASNDAPSAEESDNKPEEKKYDYTFNMLASENGGDIPLYIYTENKPSGEVISNALYHRYELMKSVYGVTLEINVDSNYKETITTTGTSGDYAFDISLIHARDTLTLAQQGYYHNILDLKDSIKLDATYWDQRIQNEYRINDMLFTLEGDYTYNDEMRTMVVIYNDKLYKDNGYDTKYGSPYSMVENNEWTYETMMEMIVDMAWDSSSDDKMNEDDTWGMVSELTATYYFLLGAGLKTMTNVNGELTLQVTDQTQYERLFNVIEKTMSMADNKDIIMANGGAISVENVWGAASDIFETDRALFRTTTLSAVNRLVDMKSDYGILPIPQFYEDQEGYYCWVSGVSATPLAISRFVPDATVTAEIVERLCYHSRYGEDTLYSAFFDQMAYSRICRSAEDIKMLELVIESKTFDLDQAANITGIEASMYSLAKAKNFTAISSTISSKVGAAKTTLDIYLVTMLANNAK